MEFKVTLTATVHSSSSRIWSPIPSTKPISISEKISDIRVEWSNTVGECRYHHTGLHHVTSKVNAKKRKSLMNWWTFICRLDLDSISLSSPYVVEPVHLLIEEKDNIILYNIIIAYYILHLILSDCSVSYPSHYSLRPFSSSTGWMARRREALHLTSNNRKFW